MFLAKLSEIPLIGLEIAFVTSWDADEFPTSSASIAQSCQKESGDNTM